MISQPKDVSSPNSCPDPTRVASSPKSNLKMQNGTPMVRAWKVGDKKKFSSILWIFSIDLLTLTATGNRFALGYYVSFMYAISVTKWASFAAYSLFS